MTLLYSIGCGHVHMNIIKVGDCTCILVVANIIPDTRLGSNCTYINPKCCHEGIMCVSPCLCSSVSKENM